MRNIHHGKRKTFCQIAKILNSRPSSFDGLCLDPPAGKKWYATTIKNILERPAVKIRKKGRKKTGLEARDYLTPGQASRAINVLTIQSEQNSRSAVRQFVFVLLISTGLRVAEACDLKLKDLPDGEHGHGKNSITVRFGKGRKGGDVRISPLFRAYLKSYIDIVKDQTNKTEPLLRNEAGKPMTTEGLRRIIYGAGRKTDLPILHPHCLRHTYASILYWITKDIQLVRRQLRHASIATTDIYVDLIETEYVKGADSAVDQMVALVNPRYQVQAPELPRTSCKRADDRVSADFVTAPAGK